MSHRYTAGQMLELRSAPRLSNRPSGPCEVITCLPHERGPVLYRVKSLGENIERVVEEGDLAPSSATKTALAENETAFTIAISKR
ncbi:hypothetical protein SAMN06295905_2472 [Devosia lucknowensis]|uniref:Uncharacterized protein n=1 Tax=Devosia lucknowensis TaxID=1096929 RepID=A0A1Y6FLT1_9HYPH|nr:hypothetical protein [Devosia lucknowensis]SMQ75944.1 hypothetical protein SAMN06295905_2472 [Devosia lucknowensis]